MNIVIVSATSFEILPLLEYLKKNFKNKDEVRFFNNKLDIHILETGVGSVHTTFALTQFFNQLSSIDLAINMGIAGAFDRKLPIGEVVQVKSDRFGDLGVEEKDGRFTDVFELGLVPKNTAPYTDGQIKVDTANDFLPAVAAITVNKVHGTAASIQKIEQKYQPTIESMEGAAFMYCCAQFGIKGMQIRSISNYVEPRNKANWDIPLAIDNLNKTVIEMLEVFLEE